MRVTRKIQALFFVLIILLSNSGLYAQAVQQILIPKEVFVGDTAQLKYSFRSAVDLFAFSEDYVVENETLEISPALSVFSSLSENCTIESITLSRNGLNYTLDILFIPWMPGEITFPSIDLVEAISESTGKDLANEVVFYADIKSVQIASLSQRLEVTEMRPPAPPLTVPGTNYWIWSIIILFLVLLILIGMFVNKIQQMARLWESWRRRTGNFLNARTTVSKIRRILRKKKDTDMDFAYKWQSSMRVYLEHRFNESFDSVPSSRIVEKIRTITGDMLSGEQQCALEELSGQFRRTDYIRFAQGSIDMQSVPLERNDMISQTEDIISVLEKKPESEAY